MTNTSTSTAPRAVPHTAISPQLLSSPSEPELKRALGPVIAVAVVVGDVIGSGIFLKPGGIAADAGQFGLIISVWILGGILCVLGGLCYAELGTMYPRAGGLYVYLREAFGRPIAFLFGWLEAIFSKPATIGALAVAFVSSFLHAIKGDPQAAAQVHPVVQVLLAAALIVGLSWVNCLGVVWGGRMQLLTTVIKAGFLGTVAILPFLMTPFTDSISWSNYATTIEPRQPTTALQISAVLLAVMWAYNGWHGITPLAEEVRDPQRNIPLALLGGIGILMVLYVGANVAYHGVLSMSEMAASGEHAAENMVGHLLGDTGKKVMAAVIMCSTFGAINSTILQTPRVTFAMGRDRVFFPILGRVHAEFRTPVVAIVVLALMSILLVAGVALGKWIVAEIEVTEATSGITAVVVKGLQGGTIFSLLTNFIVFASSIFYVLGVLAVLVLRYRQPDKARPYRTWGYPFTPIAFLLVYVWFLWQVYGSNPLEARLGLLVIAAGLPVYWGYQRWQASRAAA